MISILWYLTHIGAKTDAPKDIDCTSTWFTFHNVAYAFSCITNKFFSLVSSTNFFLLYHQQIFFSCIINNFFSLVSSTIFFLLYHQQIFFSCIINKKNVQGGNIISPEKLFEGVEFSANSDAVKVDWDSCVGLVSILFVLPLM
jgi:hypothetical protein